MKYMITITCLLFFSFTSPSSNVNEVVDQIKYSFKNGNSQLLSTILANEVELDIESEKISYPSVSNERAGMILSSFFHTNPPVNFKYVYQGKTSEDLKYCVGNYNSMNKTFLVYMLISKDVDKRFVVKSLQLKES